MSTEAFVRKKRWHAKSRSGCLTCRKRRVKCDEHRPTCMNCSRNDFACEGRGYGSDVDTDSQSATSETQLIFVPWSLPEVSRDSTEPQESQTSTKHLQLSAGFNDFPVIPPCILQWSRQDPFDAFCVESSSEDQRIFDHSIATQWALFAPSRSSRDLALVKSQVMGYAVNNPVSYHTLLFAGACHHYFWGRSAVRRADRDPQLLWFKTQALRAMREAVQKSDGAVTDDILIAALMLAVFDSGDKARRRPLGKVQSRKALIYTLDAEFYAALDVEWKHLNIFYDLVERRGGILTMQPSALRTSAILFDVFNAYIHLSQPRIRALAPLDATLAMRYWQPDKIASDSAGVLGTGFQDVFDLMPQCAETVSLRQVFEGSILTMLDFDQIMRSKDGLLTETELPHEQTVIWVRSMLIHELLSLPESLATHSARDEFSVVVYEICRFSYLMFSQLWLFADINTDRGMARKQVAKLKPLLERATSGNISSRLCERLPDFYLWVIALGLMLAYEEFDISKDRGCLEELVPFAARSLVKMQPKAWRIVSSILPRFVWRWKDCELTGSEAWELACQAGQEKL